MIYFNNHGHSVRFAMLVPNQDVEDYPAPLSARIGFLLAKAHQNALETTEAALEPLGLSRKAYAALATIVSEGPLSQQAISRRIGVDPATMVEVIDQLEAAGWVERRRNPDDRRQYALEATRSGRRLYSRAQLAVIAAERSVFRSLDAREVKRLSELLQRVAGES
jgi:DNA-binding MarR family transcriptional regulator